jgi:cytochrome c oxidase assembly factor 1
VTNNPAPELEEIQFRWSRTLPGFAILMALASLAIFNYQKSSSPVVSATMYALRTHQKAREYLGDEIYYKDRIPIIWGEMNQMQGRINIHFSVKGTRNTGVMTFSSFRESSKGQWETMEWSLETADGKKMDLLQGEDPFQGLLGGEDEDVFEERGPETRGYRQTTYK